MVIAATVIAAPQTSHDSIDGSQVDGLRPLSGSPHQDKSLDVAMCAVNPVMPAEDQLSFSNRTVQQLERAEGIASHGSQQSPVSPESDDEVLAWLQANLSSTERQLLWLELLDSVRGDLALTQEVIGQVIGCTRGNVSLIERAALRKLSLQAERMGGASTFFLRNFNL